VKEVGRLGLAWNMDFVVEVVDS
jgi:hypothetical protein